ncbi:NADP-dependent oxidoreductase [Streptomyces sp. NPDC059917]|uniref:NADP-dependent oxidoreductase n=1 Tax=Streptomyces sp. NPDC059917 TaxID=3347002 RepID=UPI00364D898F
MDAAVVTAFGGPEQVVTAQVPLPVPGAGQVRVRVRAAGLNPVDALVRLGVFGGEGERLGFGWDVAGEVDAVGAGVTAWSAGQQVVGLHYGPVKELGTHAQYVVLDEGALAAAPGSVGATAAAVLPLSGLTAARALDQLGLAGGESVLVTGAAGVVGGLAVQLAVHAGLKVTALAGPADEELVRSLGATDFVARGTAGADAGVRVDGVLDAAVLGEAALDFVRDGGVYVGLRPGGSPAPVRGIRVLVQEVAADGAHLARLVSLVDEGALTLRVGGTYALADAAAAHARLAEGGARGRLVLTVA